MLKIKKDFFEQIVGHCKQEFPNEACGLLAGKNGEVAKAYEAINVDKSPESFLMDTKEQLKIIEEILSKMLGLK